MVTFILILILVAITVTLTFLFTRSLYINHYKDWYRTAIDYQSIDDDSEESGKKMYNKLAGKYASIYNIDHTIIPEWVKDTMSFNEEPFAKGALRDTCRAARWLGYDLTLTKRQLPPPPKFKLTASPSAIREELVECWEAEGRLEEN